MEAMERMTGVDRRLLRTVLLSTAVFGFLAHGFLFSNEFFSHDSISYFSYADWGFPFYLSVGRFLIPVLEWWKGGAASPWLGGMLFLLWMSLAAAGVIRILGIRSLMGQVFTCGLLCTNLSLTLAGATYVYCLDEYALALLLAVLAAGCILRGGWAALAGLGLLVLSLGIYQPYFTVAASLCLMGVLRQALEESPMMYTLGKGVYSLCLLAAGFAAYTVLWTALCGLTGTARRREGMSFSWKEIPGLAAAGLGRYARFLFTPAGVLGWLLPVLHVVLLLLLAWRLSRILPALSPCNRVLVMVCVCLLPVAFGSAGILIPADAHALTGFARELIWLLPFLREDLFPWPPKLARTAQGLICAAVVLVLWHHVVFANQAYMKKDLEKNATLTLAARILDRVENTEGYVPGETPVAFAGRLDENPYYRAAFRTAFSDLYGQTGLFSPYAATYNLGRYLTDYLHEPLVWDQDYDADGSATVGEMPPFPAAGSVRLTDGRMVVRLS